MKGSSASVSMERGEVSRKFTVLNEMGIHARPAAMIVRIANRYSEVDVNVVNRDGEEVNGKSIMGLMMLAAGKGTVLEFRALGDKGEQFLSEVEDLFKRKFEEA